MNNKLHSELRRVGVVLALLLAVGVCGPFGLGLVAKVAKLYGEHAARAIISGSQQAAPKR